MGTRLADILKNHIDHHGPMDVGQFMALALAHPQHGYYMRRDPFGVDGDFTTAPEISQMFGEMLGAWTAQTWMDMGRPECFYLLECGPGRGTLMADMMRGTSGVAGFQEACNLHLLEISPVLQEKQAEALQHYEPRWHETLESVPGDAPMIVIGNEFLDALPVRQFEKTAAGWYERMVACEGDDFIFVLRPCPEAELLLPGARLVNVDALYEFSPAADGFIRALCRRLKAQRGAALFVDYGHVKSGAGETLQALHKHEYVSPLSHIGEADITAHVDFEMIARAAEEEGVKVSGLCTQGEFLSISGIEARADYLKRKANEAQKRDIESALHRLTHTDEMGGLFKVIGFEGA